MDTTYVNHDLQRNWIKALRSGKYEQTSGWLHNDKGFCCLGVVCDVLGLPVKDERDQSANNARAYILDPFKQWSDDIAYARMLPDRMANVLGLNSDQMHALASSNDKGMTFSEIADDIERYWQINGTAPDGDIQHG